MTPQGGGDRTDLLSRTIQLEARMNYMESFIPQINAHMRTTEAFMTTHAAEEKDRERREIEAREDKKSQDERRAKIHFWWLGILSALIVASIIGLATWMMNFMSNHHISSNSAVVSQTTTQHAKEE